VLGLAAADEAVDANKSGGSGGGGLQPAGNHWLDTFAGANRGRVARPRQGRPQLSAQTETALWSQKRPLQDYVRKQFRRFKKKMNVQAQPPEFKEYIHKQLSRWKSRLHKKQAEVDEHNINKLIQKREMHGGRSKSEYQIRPRAASAPPAFKEYIHKQLSRWKSRLHKKQAEIEEHNINNARWWEHHIAQQPDVRKREKKGGRSKSEHQVRPQAASAFPAFKENKHRQLSQKQAEVDAHNINKLIKKREMKGGRSRSEDESQPRATSAPFGVARWDANGDPIAEVRPKRIGLKTAGIDTDSWAGRDFTDVAGRHHAVPSIW